MKRRIVIVAYPDVELLDVAGPASVFANAGLAHYAVSVFAPAVGAVATSSRLGIVADHSCEAPPRGVDTLLVAGGEGTRAACADPQFLDGVRRLARRARRVASVCSGSFILAAAGLLDGRRATTHWRYAGELARLFPQVRVEADAIWVRDGEVWTSAGVTAGIDLALALVEDDLGRHAALAVARELVVYIKRPGGQTQYSAPLAAQASALPALERIRRDVLARPQHAWSLDELAERAHVSPRHLRRLFQRELAVGPREFVARVRLGEAQRLLADSAASLREVARRCGYANADAFRRRFEAAFGIAPLAWRERFHGGAAGHAATPARAPHPSQPTH
jgi:transcriptional regulator GlxA family with amidase domain